MSAVARTRASPYARRLARERGITLSVLGGSGPNGRIVAADVPVAPLVPVAPSVAVVANATPASVAAPVPVAAPSRAIGAFAATVNLVPLSELSASFGIEMPLAAFLIKAVSRAAGDHATSVSWRPANGAPTTLARAHALAPSEIARRIGEGVTDPASDRLLVLSHLMETGIRPLSASLADDADLRIVFSAGESAGVGEALLAFDEDQIGEAAAAHILAAFRDLIEAPLRLLV